MATVLQQTDTSHREPETAARPGSAPSRALSADRPVAEIIDQARTAPAPRRGALAVSLGTALLMWLAFYPTNWGPLAWLAPIPLLMLVRTVRPPRWMYRSVFLGGLLFWTISLQWMRLGHVTMVPAWLALATYLALYFPAFLGGTRLLVHRLHVPLALAAPLTWVGLDYLRSRLITGFGWYQLAHSQHEWTSLVQISDLVGAYGVTFLILLTAAAAVLCIPLQWFSRLRLIPLVGHPDTAVLKTTRREQIVTVAMAGTLVAAAVGYGQFRRQGEFPAGPRVALIQGDFRSEVKHDPDAAGRIYMTHFNLTGRTVKYRPDVIVWPETMFPYPMLLAEGELTSEQLKAAHPNVPPQAWNDPQRDVRPVLRDRAEQAGAAMIIGIATRIARAEGGVQYNSAVLVEPQAGVTGRYDKLHRVPFGEYIPLRDWVPFLSQLTPFGDSFGIEAGEVVHVFEVDQWRLMPLICFEDTVPHLVRNMLQATGNSDGHEVDCLVNLTNDGWFRDSSEQEQHLVTATFRCIETRTPMVRAVNTGISAIIDGDGIVREPLAFIDGERDPAALDQPGPVRQTLRDPGTGNYHKSMNAALVADVPLDPRGSLYLRMGDWFAGGCLTLLLAGVAFATLNGRIAARSATAA